MSGRAAFPARWRCCRATAWVGIYGLSFVTVLAASLPALLGTPSLTPLGRCAASLPAIAAAR